MTSRATWVTPDLVAWDVVDEVAAQLTYRLHYGPAGSLALDAETLGGASLPLSRDPAGLPATVVARHPALVGTDALTLAKKTARDAAAVAGSEELALAAYDGLGRLVDASRVTVVPWADLP